MILFVVLFMNGLPPVGKTPKTYSPINIMTDFTLDYSKNCRVQVGTYAEKQRDVPPTNTMYERSQGDIYLVTNTNFQDSCNFKSLRKGKIITRNQFTIIPIPQYVINK